MSSERDLRAAKRRNWPGGLERMHRPAQLSSASARLHSMWPLALDSWSLTGKPLPNYERHAIPGKLIRRK